MQTHPLLPRRPDLPRAIVCAAVLFGATRLAAQAVPGAAAKPAVDKSEELVVLSPFTVVSDDKGYQALNTLAGTRINSKLEDLGASITVVTMQQMQDMAVVDLNDVFRYEASTEGTDNFTQFTPNRAGGVGDNVSQDPARANRIRGVGSAGTSGSGVNLAFGNNAVNSKIPVDLYNIDALEISRGPNSNLFGLGASAGTINLVPSLANLNRATSSVSLRFDDWGGHRESLNLNRPLIKGKLALRLATVHDDKAFTRKPSDEKINRLYAAVTAQPFKQTTIRGMFERYDNRYNRPNSLMPRDTAQEWRASGGPTWDPTTQLVTMANGQKLTLAAAQAAGAGLINATQIFGRPIAIIDNGAVQQLTTARIANPITTGTPSPYTNNSNVAYVETATFLMRNKTNLFPLFFQPAVKDRSIYDWKKLSYTAPNWGHDDAKTVSTEVEQTFLRNERHHLAARAGWFRQEFLRDSHFGIDVTDTVIYVDVNEKLLDGKPNPYFKRPYVESIGSTYTRVPETSDVQSADLAYQVTPPKTLPRWLSWIGQQRIATHGETVRNDTVNYRTTPNISDDHAWTNRANRSGATPIVQRYYVGDNAGQNLDYGTPAIKSINGSHTYYWFNNLTGQWVNEAVKVDPLALVNTTANRSEIRTLSAAAQGFFFDNRLVATYGWRRDRRRERTTQGVVVDPATGLVSYNALKNWNAWTDDQSEVIKASQRGDTKTWGLVGKPLSWLNLHYNQSDSFFPQVVRQQLDLKGNIPNPRGEGKDYGVTFTLLDNKLSLRINRFKVTEYDSRGSEVGTIGNRTFRLEGRAEANGQRDVESLYPFVENVVRLRLANQGIANPSQAQLRPAIAKMMGQSDAWLNIFLDSGLAQPQTVGTTDVTSQGWEVEAIYNPTRNWRVKFTAAQAEAFDQAISPEIFNYWQSRLATWTTVRADRVPGSGDGQGALWWSTVASNNTTPEASYLNGLISPYLVGVANVGKPRTQVRKYRWAAVTNYDFTEGRLKNFNFGGALRWEDKASIGFGGKPPATSGNFAGAILELDKDKPFYDRARYYADLSAGYRFKLWNDKIRAKVQLNIKDAFESGRLQKVGVNPDGSTYAYRIINPRQFILSTSFDL
ncbi:MAG: TonB-dependent receptor plug domain-containing protein [Verrucomicrobia bacterium]|nr:TonB-dependent receptor plug domain-containing protein [Verrucomicrobiota bacterium]